jgi:hypothetical protein
MDEYQGLRQWRAKKWSAGGLTGSSRRRLFSPCALVTRLIRCALVAVGLLSEIRSDRTPSRRLFKRTPGPFGPDESNPKEPGRAKADLNQHATSR